LVACVASPAQRVPRAHRPVVVLPARTTPRAVVRCDGIRPGLFTVVPEGAYRGTVAWSSSTIFLKGLRLGLQAHPERLRTSEKDVIALDMFMTLVELAAASAEPGTGRDVRGHKKTIAAAAGCSPATVQRFGRIASRVVGCLQLIVGGRQLTIFERLDVWDRDHRCKQHGVPPVRAFHVPAWLRPFMAMAAIQTLPVDNHTPADLQVRDPAHPPGRASVFETTHLADTPPSRSTSQKGGSLRSPRGPGCARAAPTRQRRPRSARQLAVEVVRTVPWLRSESPRRLENALKRFAVSRPVWTAQDLLDAIRTVREVRGLVTALTDDRIRTRPAVVLAAFLRELDAHDDHPRLAVVEPAELRCGRDECDHGWITDADHYPLHRCDQCRHGAWPAPSYEDLYGDPW